jgi:hypothetical protein
MGATVAMKSHLWLNWARIAIRQERRAWDARKAGQTTTQFIHELGLETEEAIQAIAASRHCIHNLYRVWSHDIGKAEKNIEPRDFSTALPADQTSWRTRIRNLIGDRDEAVHHDEEYGPPQPHPGYPGHVSRINSVFTAERATEVVDVMMDDVLRLALTAPPVALAQWSAANRHVMALLDSQRATGDYRW